MKKLITSALTFCAFIVGQWLVAAMTQMWTEQLVPPNTNGQQRIYIRNGNKYIKR